MELISTLRGASPSATLSRVPPLSEARQEKYLENQLKCTKARNDYLLNLAVANAALSSYFIQDVSHLIDYWDLGFHSALSRTLRTYLRAESSVETSRREGLKIIEAAVDSLDPQSDKMKIMDINCSAFCLPNKLEFLPHDQDQVCEVRTESAVYQELLTRFQNLQTTLVTAKLETEEINKTLKATLRVLQDLVTTDDYDIPDIFQPSRSTESVKSVGSGSGSGSGSDKANITKRRSNQQDTETYYFTKVKEYVDGSNRITKLDAKYKLLKSAIDKGVVENENTHRLSSTLGRSQRQRKPRPCSLYNQKLFNGELEIFIK
ncbi:SLIT-ROBO Rho GTPase-activating protein 3-like, partial [Heptranchias perlo]|uniref:SLIT-ROBO Rho GTPase-activating protein 3-like n=1 Tax=Heptranchias perlo TaxID=212740 RepID=UPI00355A4975